jgi:hypothetical protein
MKSRHMSNGGAAGVANELKMSRESFGLQTGNAALTQREMGGDKLVRNLGNVRSNPFPL